MVSLTADSLNEYDERLFEEPWPPRCGWLSPEGLFAPCVPWGHGVSAWEIVHALGLDSRTIPGGDAHEYLWKQGWIKIARKNRANRAREGGRFTFEHPGYHHKWSPITLTTPQADVERVWMEAGAYEYVCLSE